MDLSTYRKVNFPLCIHWQHMEKKNIFSKLKVTLVGHGKTNHAQNLHVYLQIRLLGTLACFSVQMIFCIKEIETHLLLLVNSLRPLNLRLALSTMPSYISFLLYSCVH